MKLYGETLKSAQCENYTHWSGTQSRKVAARRRKDAKVAHRAARNAARNEIRRELNS